MKKGLKIAIGIIAGLGIVIAGGTLVLEKTSDVAYQTSISGFVGTNYYYNNASSVFHLSIPGDEEYVKSKIAIRDEACDAAVEIMKNADPEFFAGKYNSNKEIVFPIDNVIYYYRNDVYDSFFCYNKDSGEITACSFSQFAINKEKTPEQIENMGMHNFSVSTNIVAEGLMNRYPGLEQDIAHYHGPFYESDIFYDDGRVFYEKLSYLMEYIPEKKESRKIIKVTDGQTLDEVFAR